jgi:AcrR family transcriptional regulator
MSDAGGESRGYHHGDLRETLMQAALESIEAHGTEQLSLRALARQAGVSPTAPYRHFPSKRCLLAALITRGFGDLERSVRLASEAAPDDPGERLLAAGLGYVAFALEHPTCYHLMFSTVLGDFSDYQELQKAAERSYAVVLAIIEQLLARPGAPELSVAEAGGVCWTAVHGLSSLLLFGRDRGPAHASQSPMGSLALLEQDPERALRRLLRGLIG